MKKFARIISSVLTITALTLVPAVAHAQVDPLEVEDPSATTEIPTTGAETPATPDTGIAPSENKVVANTLVFIGGSALGAAVGYGFLSYRKKHQS